MNNESAKIQQARKEVAEDPKDANAHYNLGLALMNSIEQSLREENGLSEEEEEIAQQSEASFKKALSLSKNSHGRASIMLGWLYKFQGEYEKAVPHLKNALGLPPESDDYLKAADVLAVCYHELGKDKEALKVVKEAMKYHKNDSGLQEKHRILSKEVSAQEKDEAATNAKYDMPTDEKSQKAMKLAEELQKQMEKIMNSSDTEDAKQKKIQKAQEEYQKKVMELYK